MAAWTSSRMKTASAGRAHTAFTLIEVLVVVTIIALLIAILLPSLKVARWQAKVVVCRGNLHDLGNAFTMYANGYKSYFPETPDPSTDTFCSLWRARLLKNPQVVICPATKNRVRSDTLRFAMTTAEEDKSDLYWTADDGPTDSSGGHSYEYNGCYNGDSGYPMSHAHKRSDTFKLPPYEMMLVHDVDNDFHGSLGCSPLVLASNYYSGSGNNCPQAWDNHGETGMNMMFGDMHAQWSRKTRGMVVDYTKAKPGNIPAPKLSVNAEIEKIWIKSQYPWRVHMK